MRRFNSKELVQLGLTVTDFTRRSGISRTTFDRMVKGDPTVGETMWARVEHTLNAIKAEMQIPTPSHRRAAGKA